VTTDATVLVCRGCCCGSVDKHPAVDHDGQLHALMTAATRGAVRVRVTDCLGCCERSNVVVVRAGAERWWFGGLLGPGTVAGLARWIAGGAASPPPDELVAARFAPSDGPTVQAWPINASPPTAAGVVHDLLVAGGTWSVGVPGALADSGAIDRQAVTRRFGGTVVQAIDASGALRLRLGPSTGLFALGGRDAVVLLMVAARRESLAAPASTLTARGPDRDPVARADRAGWLFDLGIGAPATSFCVRTTDPELKATLEQAVGIGWRELLDSDVGRLIVSRSPVRVLETGAGRAEVTTQIPPIGGESPAGAHTHLDTGLLELGRELPGGIVLPDGWAPAALLQPPPGWVLPR
jgi:hypothetical protein